MGLETLWECLEGVAFGLVVLQKFWGFGLRASTGVGSWGHQKNRALGRWGKGVGFRV